MVDTEREERERRRTAVEREMSRMREADERDADAVNGDEELVDAVTEEQRRERDAQNGERRS